MRWLKKLGTNKTFKMIKWEIDQITKKRKFQKYSNQVNSKDNITKKIPQNNLD